MDGVSQISAETSQFDHSDISTDTAPTAPNRLQFWEAEHTRPEFEQGGEENADLINVANSYLDKCMAHPYLPVAEIRAQQLARMKELVEMAYRDIPVYRAKYKAAGFKPSDLHDLRRHPEDSGHHQAGADRGLPGPVRQPQVQQRESVSDAVVGLVRPDAADPRRLRRDSHRHDPGRPPVRDAERQQVSRKGSARPRLHRAVVVRLDRRQVSDRVHFEPHPAGARGPASARPRAANAVLYPSNLEALMPHVDEFQLAPVSRGHAFGIFLAAQRAGMVAAARRARARRILLRGGDAHRARDACGHYHVCEDTVHLDVLDPATLQPQLAGQSGIAVITNLLNEAMPFIRYVQGDYVTLPANPEPCDNQLVADRQHRRAPERRLHQPRRPQGPGRQHARRHLSLDVRLRPAPGAVRDRADADVDLVEARFVLGARHARESLHASIAHLEDLLSMCLEHPVDVKAIVSTSSRPRSGKRRPIRREMA